MAEKFSGRWRLVSSEGVEDFYKAIGLPPADVQSNHPLDDPNKNIVNEIIVDSSDNYQLIISKDGQEVFRDNGSLGETRRRGTGDDEYLTRTVYENGALIDIINQRNVKECKYTRTLEDNKMKLEWQDLKSQAGVDEDSFRYVDSLADFESVNPDTTDYLMGLFEPSHMHYDYDRVDPTKNPFGEPSLADMVEKAVRMLSKSDEGYFLFVEAGRVDTAHHDNNAFRALNETAALHDAVARVMEMTSEEDTLIVVTADHSHVFSIAGYQAIDIPILGHDDVYDRGWGFQVGDDKLPYTTLTYANGPGYYAHRTEDGTLDTEIPRKDLTGIDTEDPDYLQDAGVPLYSETHGAEDVAIFARGPMAHLFQGVQEQNYIAHVMKYAACVGDNTDLCDNPPEPICDSSSATSHNSNAQVFQVKTVLIMFSICTMFFAAF